MAWAPFAIAGLQALSSLFASKKKQTEQTQDRTQTDTYDRSSLPIYDPKQQDVRDRILNELLARSEEDPNLTGYTASGLSNIGKGFETKQRMLQNLFTSRGLGGSPMAASGAAALGGERIGEQIDFLNQVPLLRDDLRRRTLGDLSNFFGQLPVGQRQTGTGTMTGRTTSTNVDPGDPWGGFATGLTGSLAGLIGKGAFGSRQGVQDVDFRLPSPTYPQFPPPTPTIPEPPPVRY